MNIITAVKNVPNIVTRAGGRNLLAVQKHIPEILTGLGVIGGIASTVLACKATLKVEAIVDEHRDTMDMIKTAEIDHEDEYSQKDAQKDKVLAYSQTVGKLIKAYSPAITLCVASTACVLGGFGIMKKRNVAIAAAYSVVKGKFDEYRGRVRDELGEVKDKEFLHGLKSQKVTVDEIDEETGKRSRKKKDILVPDPNGLSQYAKFFDDASPNWVNNPEANLLFLKAQQNYANDRLHAYGHVFLNEAYDMLGIPRTSEGAIVGWTMSDDGDNFIDFGIHSIYNTEARDFVNGYTDAVLLDFNVDGIIYDLI